MGRRLQAGWRPFQNLYRGSCPKRDSSSRACLRLKAITSASERTVRPAPPPPASPRSPPCSGGAPSSAKGLPGHGAKSRQHQMRRGRAGLGFPPQVDVQARAQIRGEVVAQLIRQHVQLVVHLGQRHHGHRSLPPTLLGRGCAVAALLCLLLPLRRRRWWLLARGDCGRELNLDHGGARRLERRHRLRTVGCGGGGREVSGSRDASQPSHSLVTA